MTVIFPSLCWSSGFGYCSSYNSWLYLSLWVGLFFVNTQKFHLLHPVYALICWFQSVTTAGPAGYKETIRGIRCSLQQKFILVPPTYLKCNSVQWPPSNSLERSLAAVPSTAVGVALALLCGEKNKGATMLKWFILSIKEQAYLHTMTICYHYIFNE